LRDVEKISTILAPWPQIIVCGERVGTHSNPGRHDRMKQLPAAGCQLPVKCPEAKCESRLFFAGAKANQEELREKALISGMGNETFSGFLRLRSG
jgi:hypothetical protein